MEMNDILDSPTETGFHECKPFKDRYAFWLGAASADSALHSFDKKVRSCKDSTFFCVSTSFLLRSSISLICSSKVEATVWEHYEGSFIVRDRREKTTYHSIVHSPSFCSSSFYEHAVRVYRP